MGSITSQPITYPTKFFDSLEHKIFTTKVSTSLYLTSDLKHEIFYVTMRSTSPNSKTNPNQAQIILPPGISFHVIYLRRSDQIKHEGTPVLGATLTQRFPDISDVKIIPHSDITKRTQRDLDEFLTDSNLPFFEIDDLSMFTQSDNSHMYTSDTYLTYPAYVNEEKLSFIQSPIV